MCIYVYTYTIYIYIYNIYIYIYICVSYVYMYIKHVSDQNRPDQTRLDYPARPSAEDSRPSREETRPSRTRSSGGRGPRALSAGVHVWPVYR